MWDINKTSFKEKQNSTGMSETGTKNPYMQSGLCEWTQKILIT